MVDITEQIVREAPDIEAYKIGLLQSAKALADRGVNLPTQQVAGMSGLQNQAINMATQGIGAYQPYVTEAGYTLGDAQTALGGVAAGASPYQQESANFFRSGAEALPGVTNAATQGYQQAGQIGMNSAFAGMAGLNPMAAQAYYNPYETQAVQQAMSDIGRQGDIQQQSLAAKAVGAGAFGGSRQGIESQELNRNVLDQQSRTAAQMRQTGYDSAASRALQAAQLTGQLGSMGSQAQQAAAQGMGQIGMQGADLYGQLGQGIGNLGTSYGQLGLQQGEALGQLGLRQASMGELGQKLGQSEQGFLFDIGKQQQAQQQAEIEAARTSQLQQLYEPYQRVSFLSDIYKGAPSSQQSLTGATTPNISPAQSILGLGIAGLSAASGAQRAGLFG
jgi:hypothetical protein|tara:strand:- start:563 stop:1732 length:1170 start_codon:yes stop_codon:yes gene_type:complete